MTDREKGRAWGRRAWFWLTVRMWAEIALYVFLRIVLLAIVIATLWKVWR